MLEVREQAGISVREGRAATGFEHVHLRGRMLTTDEIQPLLYVRLVREPRSLITACGFEEGVEVELVELTLMCDSHQVIRHPVGEQPHFWQSRIRVPFAGVLAHPFAFRILLVGVGPVEDLLLDELTRCQSLEGCAREVEVGACRNGKKVILITTQLVELFVEGS